MLTVTCAKCGRFNKVADGQAGQSIACGQCGATVRVPAAPPPLQPPPLQPPPPQPPPLPRSPLQPPPPMSPPPLPVGSSVVPSGGPTGTEYRPPPAVPAGLPPRGRRIGFRVNRGTLVLLVGGVILLFVGAKMLALSRKAKPAAQKLTCQQLVEHGYGDNAHVRLSDFQALNHFVYQYADGSSGPWSVAYVPAASFDLCREHLNPDGHLDFAAVQNSPGLRVILQCNVKSESELGAITKQDAVEGMVVNDIAPLDTKERDLLSQSYPAMNLDRCWVLHVGRTYQGVLYPGLGMVAGGLLALALGLWLTFKPD